MTARPEILIALLAVLIAIASACVEALPLVLSGLAMAFTLYSLEKETRAAPTETERAKVRQDSQLGKSI